MMAYNRDACRKYHAKNRETINERNRKKYWSDPEAARDRLKKWRKENPEKARLKDAMQRQKNPEYYRTHAREYARKKSAIVRAVKKLGLINIGELKC
jgi:hypothetical protein